MFDHDFYKFLVYLVVRNVGEGCRGYSDYVYLPLMGRLRFAYGTTHLSLFFKEGGGSRGVYRTPK